MVTRLTGSELGSAGSPSRPNLSRVVFIAAAAATGGLLFGYDTAVINGAVTGIEEHFQIGKVETGAIVSVALLGCAAGAALAGRLAERFGRQRVMQVAALLFLISSIGSMLPFTPWLLAFWRVVGGTAIGAASVIGPLYIAEVSPPAYRGRLASFQQLAIVLGIAISQLVNYLLAALAGGRIRGELLGLEAWQWMLGTCAVPALGYFILATAIPESPRYLIMVGQEGQARDVLADIEGAGVDLDARVVEIRSVMAAERAPKLTDLLGRFLFLPVVWVGIGMAAFQQLVGINVVFYYSSALWQSVGIDESDSLFWSFSTAIVNIIGTVIAMAAIDQVGRKALCLVGSAGMALALAVSAWAFGHIERVGGQVLLPHAEGLAALIAAHAFVFFFALSWGVVLWVLLGEMFPGRIRAAAISLATAANWITNWAVTATFPKLSAWGLSATYAGYALFAALSLVFVVLFVRETMGKTLEEMG